MARKTELEHLNERNQQIIRYVSMHVSYSKTGEIMGLTRNQVCSVCYRHSDILQKQRGELMRDDLDLAALRNQERAR